MYVYLFSMAIIHTQSILVTVDIIVFIILLLIIISIINLQSNLISNINLLLKIALCCKQYFHFLIEAQRLRLSQEYIDRQQKEPDHKPKSGFKTSSLPTKQSCLLKEGASRWREQSSLRNQIIISIYSNSIAYSLILN